MLHSKITPEGTAPIAQDDADLTADRRRGSQRYVTVLKVGRAVIDGHDQLCLVRNMSREGAKLDLRGSGVHKDQKILVELRSDKVVTGTVRWTGDHVAGIEFDEPVNVQDMLQNRSTRSVLRKLPRAPRFLAAGHARMEMEKVTIGGSIINISLHGMCMETSDKARVDEQGVVKIEGLSSRRCSIRWMRDGMIGLHFDMPMGFSELARWLEDHQPTG